MNILFSKLESNDSKSEKLDWYTWSSNFRRMLSNVATELSDITLSVEKIESSEKYGCSYVASEKESTSNQLKVVIDEACNELYKINHRQKAFLLCNLTSTKFDSDCLKKFITLVSENFRKKTASFHSPIKESQHGLAFPLHADLFGPRALVNVMTDVYPNTGGDILLVKRKNLLKALRSLDVFDDEIISQVNLILINRHKYDLFDRLYNFLYGNEVLASQLQHELDKYTIKIPNKNGNGYFIEDGEWLHGRAKVNVSVSENRIQRLVFDTKSTLDIPTLNVNSSRYLLSSYDMNDCNFELFEMMKSKSSFQSQKSVAHFPSNIA